MGVGYSASSYGPPAVEGYFAGGCFSLLAVLVLLQRRVTLLRWGRFYSASSSGPPAAEGYFAGELVYSASSSGPPAAEGYFAAVG
jgi:hypothetical protein